MALEFGRAKATSMNDDDWMVPRHLHTGEAEEPDEQPASGTLRIDPQFLRQRALRKQRLSPQPKSAGEPWLHLDRSMARGLPGFADRMWTLGDTARWVIERTPEAVNGLSIDEYKLLEVLPEIHAALAAGEVSSFANTSHNPVPTELPAQTWSVYELVVEEKDGLVRIFPVCSSSSEHEQHLLNVRVTRDDVLCTWPTQSSTPIPPQPKTMAAENQCRRWLAAMMKTTPAQPRAKAVVREEALTKFRGLGKRGFDRAWDAAIRETNAEQWRAPGRRS
jgi:hypothetical protein